MLFFSLINPNHVTIIKDETYIQLPQLLTNWNKINEIKIFLLKL